jgi:hypothetical protein
MKEEKPKKIVDMLKGWTPFLVTTGSKAPRPEVRE